MPTSVRLAVALVGASLFLQACDSQTPPKPPPTPVRVHAVEVYKPDDSLRYSANIEPQTSVNVAFKLNGYVDSIHEVKGAQGRERILQAGDPVEKGMVLAQIRQGDYLDQVKAAKSQLAAAEAELRKASQDFSRAKSLYDSASMTATEFDRYQKDYETGQANVTGARAQVDQAEINLRDTKLTSPLTGVVIQRNVEIGSLAAPGTVAFVVADTSSVKAVFGVPDVVLGDVKVGDPLAVTVAPFPDRQFQGTVTQIAPAADSATRVFNVEIDIPNADGDLKSGMVASLSLKVHADAQPEATVPLDAVVRAGGDTGGYAVFLVERGNGTAVARRQDVTLGEVHGNAVAIRSGLSDGQEVIVTGATKVTDGQEVRVIP